jgi:predicted HTH transcriptional regulator
VDGNAPMFSGFRDRIEILSRGALPPKQTLEGFYAGESVPVNQKLSDIFLQLHISERSGRGVPKITEIYGRENIGIKENSIVVTIPFEHIESDKENAKDTLKNPHDDTQHGEIYPHDDTQHGEIYPHDDLTVEASKRYIVEDKLLTFCVEPKGMAEILLFLGYKDRKSVRSILQPLLKQGRIAMTIPDKPKSKNQKYITIR